MPDLPFFKFDPALWVAGSIAEATLEGSGCYTSMCAYYWLKRCKMSSNFVALKCGATREILDELTNLNVLEIDENNMIVIGWLDQQYEILMDNKERQIESGRRGGLSSAMKRGFKHPSSIKNKNQNQNKNQNKNTGRATFVAPSYEEVASFCIERKNTVNPEQFFDHYKSNGWKVGKNSMKDWKASVRQWERSGYNDSSQTTPERNEEDEFRRKHNLPSRKQDTKKYNR